MRPPEDLTHRTAASPALPCSSAILGLAPAPAATQMFSVVLMGIVSDKTLGVILDERLSSACAGSDRSSAAHLAGHMKAKTSCED